MSAEDTRRRMALAAEVKRLTDIAVEELRRPSPVPVGAPGSVCRDAYELAMRIRALAAKKVEGAS